MFCFTLKNVKILVLRQESKIYSSQSCNLPPYLDSVRSIIVENKEVSILICEKSVKVCYIESAVFVLYVFLIIGF